jgi:hypothetical protein
MIHPRSVPLAAGAALLLAILAGAAPARGAGPGASERLRELLSAIPAGEIPSGILYDRVLPIGNAPAYDGSREAPALSGAQWGQIYDEMRRASLDGRSGGGERGGAPSGWPALRELRARAAASAARGVIDLGILNLTYDRLRPDAAASGAIVPRDGRLVLGTGDPIEPARLVAMAPLTAATYRGERVTFRFDRRDFYTNDAEPARALTVDFGDGRGAVDVAWDTDTVVGYAVAGTKTIRLALTLAGGAVVHAQGLFEVRGLRAPSPNDTLHLTASIPYGGVQGTGDAYVYLAEGHTTITEPVVVIEGFDIGNTMNWDEIYDLLNQQQMLETLRSEGFDAVVLNFTNAVDYIQRNAFVAVELIQQVRATIPPGNTIALVGASMGGLVGRYALDYMEANGLPHDARTFISFDSPQNGANIPLGIQYWVAFFASESTEAAALLEGLNAPGARQMLAYHYTDPPTGFGQSDPLRDQLVADFAALGDYPSQPRKVAIANGSGTGWSQGFAAGAQIIRWEHSDFVVDVTGNVWAVPDGGSRTIFHGLIDIIFFPPDEQIVTVSGTRPYDNAPGGWRNSMAEMDAVDAPYGDIVALHPNHDFIPTVSSLALDFGDLFYDVAEDPDILAHTPFDAVYFPSTNANQEHVEITVENAVWFLDEVRQGAASAPDAVEGPARVARIEPAGATPAAGPVRMRVSVPHAGPARVAVYDVLGRCVEVLAERSFEAGEHDLVWSGPAPAGVYFVGLAGTDFRAFLKLARD